mgnify:CR=1 FL=1
MDQNVRLFELLSDIRERLATLEARQEDHLREHNRLRNGDWRKLALFTLAIGGGSGSLSAVLLKLLEG